MIIDFKGRHYSLHSFISDPISDFAVITGKNGSGKTQLIDLLSIKRSNNSNYNIKVSPEFNFKAIQIGGLEITQSKEINEASLKIFLQPYESIFYQPLEHLRILELLKRHNIDINTDIDLTDIILSNDEMQYLEKIIRNVLNSINVNKKDNPIEAYKSNSIKVNDIPLRKVINSTFNLYGQEKLLFEIADFKQVSLTELTISDLYSLPTKDHFLNRELFAVQLEQIFFTYGKRRHENLLHNFLKTTYQKQNSSIPDEEFIKLNPDPVEIINSLFKSNNIQYTIKGIELGEYTSNSNYVFLLHNIHGEKINFNHLSDGEKIIIGLIIKCFIIIYYNIEVKAPPLLILDEPDAHLHPEMSKLLIDVLYKSFVQELGIKVIITTHSPSTVALAPDDSIYEIKNGPNTSLKKVSKDYALKLLTENIPTLNIDYKSHRQIFVESPTDANYYRNIFAKIHSDKPTTFQLYFISNGYGKGNCEHVKSIVSELRKAGNTTSYGIIDWDSKNASSKKDYIYVHGEGLKYSIENYLYSPLYLAVLFLEQGGANNICTELNIDKSTYNHYNIGNEPNERLQEISDWIINKIESKFSFVDKIKIPIKFLNDKEISIPKWYTTIRGHDLYSKIKEVFPSLQKFNTEIELSDKLTETVAKCYPLIDLETVKLLAEIAEP